MIDEQEARRLVEWGKKMGLIKPPPPKSSEEVELEQREIRQERARLRKDRRRRLNFIP